MHQCYFSYTEYGFGSNTSTLRRCIQLWNPSPRNGEKKETNRCNVYDDTGMKHRHAASKQAATFEKIYMGSMGALCYTDIAKIQM